MVIVLDTIILIIPKLLIANIFWIFFTSLRYKDKEFISVTTFTVNSKKNLNLLWFEKVDTNKINEFWKV